ncbi:MAG: pilus assembly protein PilM [Candidatus Sungbacteria bacterium]|nr:pilus assembly protein PilM [Candidatus Sungbacteria bacterium]
MRTIPIDVSHFVVDYTIAQETKDSLDLIIVAMPIALVRVYQKLISDSGLLIEHAALEPQSVALARSVVRGSYLRDGAALVVDFGARMTGLVLGDERGLQSSITLSQGGEEITQVIAEKFNITFEEAEQRKIQRGFQDEDMILILQHGPQLVLQEAGKLIRFYEQKNQKQVKTLLLAGGGARMPGLPGYIAMNVDKTTLLLSEHNDILYATAIGLALHPVEKTKNIDFLRRIPGT